MDYTDVPVLLLLECSTLCFPTVMSHSKFLCTTTEIVTGAWKLVCSCDCRPKPSECSGTSFQFGGTELNAVSLCCRLCRQGTAVLLSSGGIRSFAVGMEIVRVVHLLYLRLESFVLRFLGISVMQNLVCIASVMICNKHNIIGKNFCSNCTLIYMPSAQLTSQCSAGQIRRCTANDNYWVTTRIRITMPTRTRHAYN